MTRARASLLLLGVFLLGALSGLFASKAFLAYRFRHTAPRQVEELVVQRLSRRLHLDANQRQTLEQVADRTRVQLAQVRNEALPKVQAILEQAYQELRPSLRPDQQKELEKIREETRERLRRRLGRP